MSDKRIKSDSRIGVVAATVSGVSLLPRTDLGSAIATETFWDDGSTIWDAGDTRWDVFAGQIPNCTLVYTPTEIKTAPRCALVPYVTARAGIFADAAGRVAVDIQRDVPKLLVLTSRIYPVEAIEGAEHTSGDIHEAPVIAWIEGLDASGGVLDGVFRNPLITYTYWPAEDLESTGGGVLDGTFRNPLITYTYWPAEDLESTGGGTLDGVFRAALVTYTYWPAEDLESTGGGVLEGSHETA